MDNCKLVAICGPDGAGKTTLINCVQKELSDERYCFVKKRKHTCSDLIQNYVMNNSVDVSAEEEKLRAKINSIGCAFDFLQYYDEAIKDELSDNRIVVCDRYSYCYMAYALQVGDVEQYVFSLLKNVRKADLIIYVDADIETLEERLRLKNEAERHLEGFMQGYEQLFNMIDVPVVRIHNNDLEESLAKIKEQLIKLSID